MYDELLRFKLSTIDPPSSVTHRLKCLSLFFQDDKDSDVCEEEDLVGNRISYSANRKRQRWWESRQRTDEKNVRGGQNTRP